MRPHSTLLFVLLAGGLSGCGASASRAEVSAAEAQAQSARADATRDRERLIEIEARLVEMERHWARERGCAATPDAEAGDVARAHDLPSQDPLRSEGDFLAEARVAAPKPAGGATTQPATAASERERLEQLLEGLREYASDPRNGLSLERREALRVLLRRDRQLDLMNPWADHVRRGRPLDLMDPWRDQ